MRLSATSATIVLLLSCLWTVFVPASAQELPSKWYFGKKYNNDIHANWAKEGIKATDFGQGLLKVIKAVLSSLTLPFPQRKMLRLNGSLNILTESEKQEIGKENYKSQPTSTVSWLL